VGRVERITLDQPNQKAVVTISLKKGVTVYDDAIASIKTEGLIGDKYLDIDPGGSGIRSRMAIPLQIPNGGGGGRFN